MNIGFEFGMEYLADRKGEHWRMSSKEKAKLGEILAALGAKYGGGVTVPPEVALISFGHIFAAPRLIQDYMTQDISEAAGDGD